ncbi:MAG TPA: Nramp family divalent metal transporter [Candidatus Limnocylindria bacterium]|nr:Nramp family divalent metal transporter [Candidatus Limnocylindria bacterium]
MIEVSRARRVARERLRRRIASVLVVLGPGLVSGFADNDAAGITTYSLAGARYGYGMIWALLATMIALGFTQEVGARLGLATGQGLGGVIRERFGVRWTAFAVSITLVSNLGTTIAEFAGIAAALELLFHLPPQVSSVAAGTFIVLLLARNGFGPVQYAFVVVGAGVSLAYAVSAVLAHPDWGLATTTLVMPQISPTAAYLITFVGVVGTTITPWGQAFIQSYVADKGLGPKDLTGSRVDILLGTLLTNVVAWFIVVACAATIWKVGGTIVDAADAARALGPLAGTSATTLFAIGLLAASLLGLGVVPLSSAYLACEAFGFERGLHWRWTQAPVFYGLLAFFVAFGAVFIVIPGLPLIQVMFLSSVLSGLLLPIVLAFVMIIAGDRQLLGDLASGHLLLAVGWGITVLVSLMSVSFVVAQLLGLG